MAVVATVKNTALVVVAVTVLLPTVLTLPTPRMASFVVVAVRVLSIFVAFS